MQRCTLTLLLLAFSYYGLTLSIPANKEFNQVESKEFHKTIVIHSVNGKITVEEVDSEETVTEKSRYVPDTIDGQPAAEWIATHTNPNKNPRQDNKLD